MISAVFDKITPSPEFLILLSFVLKFFPFFRVEGKYIVSLSYAFGYHLTPALSHTARSLAKFSFASPVRLVSPSESVLCERCHTWFAQFRMAKFEKYCAFFFPKGDGAIEKIRTLSLNPSAIRHAVSHDSTPFRRFS